VKSNYSSQIGTSVNCTLPGIENWPEAICNQDFCNETGCEETVVEIKRNVNVNVLEGKMMLEREDQE
jgi:hypothetical protein